MMDRRRNLTAPPLKEEVRRVFDGHINEWLTTRQIADMAGITPAQARQGAERLIAEGFLIEHRANREGSRSIIKSYRTKLGFMETSKFEGMPLPSVIWIEDSPIFGPFCIHCGNPHSHHGMENECLNYRIHPLMPMGDLPRAKHEQADKN